MSKKLFEFPQGLRDKVFRFAVRLLDNHEDAKDITHDVFEKLWIKHESLSEFKNIEALSIKITRDLCLNSYKYKKRKREKLKEIEQDEKHRNYRLNYQEKELGEIAKRLIGQLPEKQKMIIHLRDVEEFEFDEIKEMLEMDINAIRMNLSRARKAIREQLLNIINHGL